MNWIELITDHYWLPHIYIMWLTLDFLLIISAHVMVLVTVGPEPVSTIFSSSLLCKKKGKTTKQFSSNFIQVFLWGDWVKVTIVIWSSSYFVLDFSQQLGLLLQKMLSLLSFLQWNAYQNLRWFPWNIGAITVKIKLQKN